MKSFTKFFALPVLFTLSLARGQCALTVSDVQYHDPTHSMIFTINEVDSLCPCAAFDVQVKPTGLFWEWHNQTAQHPMPEDGNVWIGMEKVTTYYDFDLQTFTTVQTPQWEFRIKCSEQPNWQEATWYTINLTALPPFPQ